MLGRLFQRIWLGRSLKQLHLRHQRKMGNNGAFIRDAKRELTDCFRRELESLCKRIGEENMGSAFGSCSIMEEAPVVIMVWNAGEMGWETEKHSVAAAIQNMLLKAYSLGLGCLWIGDIFFTVEALEQHLGKPWKLLAAVTLGYPAYIPKGPWNGKPRKTVDEVAEFLG